MCERTFLFSSYLFMHTIQSNKNTYVYVCVQMSIVCFAPVNFYYAQETKVVATFRALLWWFKHFCASTGTPSTTPFHSVLAFLAFGSLFGRVWGARGPSDINVNSSGSNTWGPCGHDTPGGRVVCLAEPRQCFVLCDLEWHGSSKRPQTNIPHGVWQEPNRRLTMCF